VDGPQALPAGELKNRISNAVVQLMHDYTGRGPTRARTYVDDDLVTILLRDTMTTAETNLADAGQEAFVLELRQKFQETMRHDLVGVVEQHTGRTVDVFMSSNSIHPDAAAEIFVLAPVADD
jgi:uncharacterized protein YbcI